MKKIHSFFTFIATLLLMSPVYGQLSGTYTIDAAKKPSATNYVSLFDAAKDLVKGKRDSGTVNGPGVNGPVVFKIANGGYGGMYLTPVKGASAKNRITFTSATGDSTKVKTGSIFLDSSSYVTIKGITATGTDSGLIQIYRSHDDSVSGCLFVPSDPNTNYSTCIRMMKSGYNNTIYNNHFTSTYNGFYSGNAGKHGTGLKLIKNTFDIFATAVFLGAEDNFYMAGNTVNSANVTFSLCDSNWVATGNMANVHWYCGYCSGGKKGTAVIANNFINQITLFNNANITYCHNTMYLTNTAQYYGITLTDTNPNVRILNNLIYSYNTEFLFKIDTLAKGAIIDYNMYFSKTINFEQYGSTTRYFADGWLKKQGFDSHSMFRDPRFKSLLTGDFHPQNPFVKAGLPLNNLVTADYYGVQRNMLHPSMGAVELHPDSCLSGIYTIGGSKADFATISAACSALDRHGICGKVIFKIRNGVYNEHMYVPQFYGFSPKNTVLFTSESGDSSKVTILNDASPKYAALSIDSDNYVTISHITVISTGTNAAYIRYGSHDSLSHMAMISHKTDVCATFVNNLDTGNTICNSYIHGQLAINPNTYNVPFSYGTAVIGNVFDSANTALSLWYATHFTISKNRFVNGYYVAINFANADAIRVFYGFDGIIYENRISGYPGAIHLADFDGSAKDPIEVYNNIADGAIVTGQNCVYTNIFYNTTSTLISIGTTRHDAHINVENNICESIQIVDSLAIDTLDFNNYMGNVYYYGYTTSGGTYGKKTLPEWQKYIHKDLHSVSVNPSFDKSGNYLPHYYALKLGKPDSRFPLDYYGKKRSNSRTTIGAVEMQEMGTCMSGTYTIGVSGADYKTFNAAASDLLTRGICGPVIFNVFDGTYNENVVMHPFPGLSRGNTLTFQSASGDSSKVILQDNGSAKQTLVFDSSAYITFRKMTIAGSDSNTVYFFTTRSDSLNSCLILQKSTNKNYSAITVNGGDSDIVISGCHIIGGSYGINAIGQFYLPVYYDPVPSGYTTVYNKKVSILNNTFDSITGNSLSVDGVNYSTVTGNKIGLTHAASCKGPQLLNIQYFDFSKNFINTASGQCVFINQSAAGRVSDNMIVGSGVALQTNNSNTIDICSNNIYSPKVPLSLSYYDRDFKIRNNNLVSGGKYPCIYMAYLTSIDSIDYNNYYTKGKNLIQGNVDSAQDINGLQKLTKQDQHSRSEDPQYRSINDPHVQDTALQAKGLSLPGITDDFDGRKRPYKPTIGANELNPINDFAFSFGNLCLPSVTAHFRILKYNSAIVSYKWNFGDGTGYVSGGDTTYHNYSSAGAYTVSIKMYISGGTEIGMVSHQVIINTLPKSSFGISGSTCTQSSTNFIDSSYSSLGRLKYQWNFGDNTGDTAQNTKHIYASAGTYSAALTVKDINGCSGTYTKLIKVLPVPLVAYSMPAQVCMGSTVTFNDSTAFLNGSSSITYNWNLGDGSSSASASPVHVYAKAGTDSVKLTAAFSSGCSASLQKKIIVNPVPVMNFISPAEVCQGSTVHFQDSSSANLTVHSWAFGDGGASVNQNPDHVYNSTGKSIIVLTGTNSFGCIASASKSIMINPKPVLAFSVPPSACFGSAVSFNDSSKMLNSDPLTYNWHFGDGDSSADYSPVHIYKIAGTQSVTLNGRSSEGCFASLSKNIIINQLPSASFTDSINKLAVSFYPDKTALKTYSWSFGDGNSSNAVKPVHTYAKDSTYKTILTVADNNGCQASDTEMITVSKGTGISHSFNDRFRMNIYPNPSEGHFRILYRLEKEELVKIEVTDISGKLMAILMCQSQNVGDHEVPGDVSTLADGLYILKVTLGQEVYNYRLVLER